MDRTSEKPSGFAPIVGGGLWGSLMDLGGELLLSGDSDLALEQWHAALRVAVRERDARRMASTHSSLAELRSYRGERQKALWHYRVAMRVATRVPDVPATALADTHCRIGELLVQLGLPDRAANSFFAAFQILESMDADRGELVDVLEALAGAAWEAGDTLVEAGALVRLAELEEAETGDRNHPIVQERLERLRGMRLAPQGTRAVA